MPSLRPRSFPPLILTTGGFRLGPVAGRAAGAGRGRLLLRERVSGDARDDAAQQGGGGAQHLPAVHSGQWCLRRFLGHAAS